MPYVATLQSTGTGFTLTRRYDGDIPGWGGMREHDEISVGDFAGTGRSRPPHLELARLERDLPGADPPPARRPPLHPHVDQRPARLGRVRHATTASTSATSTATARTTCTSSTDRTGRTRTWACSARPAATSSPVRLYDGDVPGWGGLAEHDQFLPADLTGNGRVGLFAWNMVDWGPNYAGRMRLDRHRADGRLAGGLGRRMAPRVARSLHASRGHPSGGSSSTRSSTPRP